MAKQKELPRGADFQREWGRLDKAGRRRVRRAANRALPARNRREAGLAASMAANQRRMWRWVWIVAPLLVALLRIPDGIEMVLANFLAGLVIFGLMAAFFYKRAEKAEGINREIFAGRKRSSDGKATRKKGAGANPSGAKSGGKGSGDGASGQDTDGSSGQPSGGKQSRSRSSRKKR